MYTPTVNSYFSGAGGLDEGMRQANLNVIQSVELCPIACETLRKNFSHKIVERDITKMTAKDQVHSDIIALTFPCNKYSDMASLHGTRTGEDLFLHGFRHVVMQRPEAFIIENVVGMKKFKVVMECFTKLPEYYVQVFCPLNASNWLPQDRQRLIVIATRRNNYIADPPPSVNRILLRDILEKDVNIELPPYAIRRLMGEYRDRPIISDPANKYELAPTCLAHYSKDFSTRMVKDASQKYGARPYTVREYARLQGFPDSFEFAGNRWDAYRQIGNAVPVDLGRWVGQQLFKYFNTRIN